MSRALKRNADPCRAAAALRRGTLRLLVLHWFFPLQHAIARLQVLATGASTAPTAEVVGATTEAAAGSGPSGVAIPVDVFSDVATNGDGSDQPPVSTSTGKPASSGRALSSSLVNLYKYARREYEEAQRYDAPHPDRPRAFLSTQLDAASPPRLYQHYYPSTSGSSSHRETLPPLPEDAQQHALLVRDLCAGEPGVWDDEMRRAVASALVRAPQERGGLLTTSSTASGSGEARVAPPRPSSKLLLPASRSRRGTAAETNSRGGASSSSGSPSHVGDVPDQASGALESFPSVTDLEAQTPNFGADGNSLQNSCEDCFALASTGGGGSPLSPPSSAGGVRLNPHVQVQLYHYRAPDGVYVPPPSPRCPPACAPPACTPDSAPNTAAPTGDPNTQSTQRMRRQNEDMMSRLEQRGLFDKPKRPHCLCRTLAFVTRNVSRLVVLAICLAQCCTVWQQYHLLQIGMQMQDTVADFRGGLDGQINDITGKVKDLIEDTLEELNLEETLGSELEVRLGQALANVTPKLAAMESGLADIQVTILPAVGAIQGNLSKLDGLSHQFAAFQNDAGAQLALVNDQVGAIGDQFAEFRGNITPQLAGMRASLEGIERNVTPKLDTIIEKLEEQEQAAQQQQQQEALLAGGVPPALPNDQR